MRNTQRALKYSKSNPRALKVYLGTQSICGTRALEGHSRRLSTRALEGCLSNQSTLVLIVKNFFFGKSNNLETTTVVENNMIISDDQKIACILIQYFDTILPKLGLGIPKDVIVVIISIEDPVLKAFNKYQRHPSLLKIKEKYRYLNFSFCNVCLSNLQNELKSLNSNKSVNETEILYY